MASWWRGGGGQRTFRSPEQFILEKDADVVTKDVVMVARLGITYQLQKMARDQTDRMQSSYSSQSHNLMYEFADRRYAEMADEKVVERDDDLLTPRQLQDIWKKVQAARLKELKTW